MSIKLRSYNLTLHQLDGNLRNLRYITEVAIPGIYSIISWNYGLGRSQEVIDGMKEAIFDFIGEQMGYEPTFETDESYEWWNGLCDDWFEQPSHYNFTNKNYQGDLRLKEEHKLNGFLFES